MPDCDGNGLPDVCQADCDGNGEADVCDIAKGAPDCNGNLVPDVCEATLESAASALLGPIGHLSPRTFTIADPSLSGTAVRLDFDAQGDFGSTVEFVTVKLNGTVIGTIFDSGAHDCPVDPDLATILVPAETWNVLVDGANAAILMTASEAVDPTPALCTSWIRVSAIWQPIAVGDCNGNGVPDSCDIASGESHDVNANGVPDECEATCAGDLDLNGVVGFSDLLPILNTWGPCADCPEDLDDNSVVGFSDVLVVLNNWGPCS